MPFLLEDEKVFKAGLIMDFFYDKSQPLLKNSISSHKENSHYHRKEKTKFFLYFYVNYRQIRGYARPDDT